MLNNQKNERSGRELMSKTEGQRIALKHNAATFSAALDYDFKMSAISAAREKLAFFRWVH